MDLFPVAAVTNDHTPGGLQHKPMLSVLEAKVRNQFHGTEFSMLTVTGPLHTLGRNPLLAFPGTGWLLTFLDWRPHHSSLCHLHTAFLSV